MNDGGYNHTMPEKPMHAHHKYRRVNIEKRNQMVK